MNRRRVPFNRWARSISGAGDDPLFPRRLMISAALAVALIEVLAGSFDLFRVPQPHEKQVATTTLTLVRRTPPPTPRPTPTPMPTPPPTPAPHKRVPVVVLTPRIAPTVVPHPQTAAPKLAETTAPKTGGAARPPWYVATRPPTRTVANAPVANTGVGAGSGTGAGAGAGTGGQGGTGNGTGGTGNGSGSAGAGDAPCGSVQLVGLSAKYNRADGSFLQYVRVTVEERNGSSVSGEFGYPFVYRSEADNPFSRLNVGRDFDIPIQLPPAGYDTSREPLAVQYTLRYTDANGLTRLPECPK